MAYVTGSAADLQSLLTAIRDFALAQGWTVDKFVGSATPASNLLFLRKGVCFATMQGGSNTFNDYTSGSAVSSNDIVLRCAIGTGITTALTTFNNHPGSLVTSQTDTDQTVINDMAGPFTSYHMFADATVGDHIHVVIQTAPERWQHFSFGHLDKGSLTHSGVAYASGVSRAWQQRFAGGSVTGNNDYNEVGGQPYPFVGPITGNNQIYGHSGGCQFHLPDALPNNLTNWPIVQAASSHSLLIGINPSRPVDYPSGQSGTTRMRLLDTLIMNPATQWAGNVLLWAMPVLITSAALSQMCYVGDFPNVRALNMEGMTPQQEILLGSDTWKVFPIGRQSSWGLKADIGDQFASGHFALAYKKVP